MRIGLDIGSTTLKVVVLDDLNNIVFSKYERHFSQIVAKTNELLNALIDECDIKEDVTLCISGSAGMGLADNCGVDFMQEVYATKVAVNKYIPDADAVIELGGEDAKILFLTSDETGDSDLEVRMNGSCAGGTGAFIDQMAALLGISLEEMNEQSKAYDKIYTIASRCGVFAKSDIQPLLNQGADKKNISASIFAAVVNQTVAGLAQGRELKGKVIFLGGPLTFMSELRKAFCSILNVDGVCPDNSLYYVALGAALNPVANKVNIKDVIARIDSYSTKETYLSCDPLFKDEAEYNEFVERHNKDTIPENPDYTYAGNVYIGVDAGSTTLKAVALDEDENILTSCYMPNLGNPVPLVKDFLLEFYKKFPNAKIASSAVTGYGEDIIKNAFCMDYGIVETMAHFTAAKKFKSDVDFIIDIGGQDIKCFKIRNGAIDNIFLNEACSSGCGSFLQTFAAAWGCSIDEFAKMGIFADRPVDLGSRCTVFMNSSVKQAQKDGAGIENISAGLSISVVKNALYKVIRASGPDELGENIVVQGGTFLNDSVLRAFELEIGRNVIRPNISGVMGACGAALYAKSRVAKKDEKKSSILGASDVENMVHNVSAITCKGCSNNCRLTVNTFNGGRKFIGGNRCEKPLKKETNDEKYNIYEYKMELLDSYRDNPGTNLSGVERGEIGLPLGLNLYEMLPFWHAMFTSLGFKVRVSPASNRKLYLKGQHTIPSDTVCYPAKLLHGHIEYFLDEGVTDIFYPCMTYNFDEHRGDNCYNCPVVAYYPEVIRVNVKALKDVNFIHDYIGIHKEKHFPKKFCELLNKRFAGRYKFTLNEVRMACEQAQKEYDEHMSKIRAKGKEYMEIGRKTGKPVVVLSGRPYHVDPEINHGIDQLICDLGAIVISEDSVNMMVDGVVTHVLNQWTYHSRMYAASKYVANSKPADNINLVQLVSFGCGVDAVTTDEIRRILENKGKIYTAVKIDEITNLGAVKIRLRSLFAALEQIDN